MFLDPGLFIILLILLALTFLFSGAETAFLTSNKTLMEFKARQLPGRFRRFPHYLHKPESFLVVILIGNNLVIVAFTTLATIELGQWLNPQLTWLVTTILLLFIGELLPKSVASGVSDRVLPSAIPLIHFFDLLFKPVIWLIESITALFFKIFSIPSDSLDSFFTRKELINIILDKSDKRLARPQKQEILTQLFELEKTSIRSIMVPRREIAALPENAKTSDIQQKFIETRNSRLLIYHEDLDKLLGYVHFHDFLFSEGDWKDKIHPIIYFPETKKIGAALSEFKNLQENIAAVVDEHGGVEGLVTIEDILENILGEIQDEYDFEEENIRLIKQNVYLASAYTPIGELNETLAMDVPEDEDYQTISGYLLKKFGRIPKVGDELSISGNRVIVIEVMRTGVKMLRIELADSINKEKNENK